MPFYNLKLSFRFLSKNRIYSSLIIGGFAIGFAVCMLIGLFYFTEKGINTGFKNHKEIYRLYDVKKNTCNLNYDLTSLLTQKYTEIVQACPMDYFNGMDFFAKDENNSNSVIVNNLICTTNSFSEVFSVNIVESSSNQLFDGKESFAITESLAQKLYKSGSAIGRTLIISNPYIQITGKITAIIEDLPMNSTFKAEILMNSSNENYLFSKTCDDKGKCWYVSNLFIQLNKGSNAESLTAHLNKTLRLNQFGIEELGLQKFDDIYLSTLTFKDMHFKGNARLLRIFIVIALLILFLSGINYLNYSISQQFAKLRTIGISKTNGASWKQLASFSLTEASLGIIIAMVLAMTLTQLLLPFSETLFGKKLLLNSTSVFQSLPIVIGIIIFFIFFNSLITLYFQVYFKITDFISGKRTRNGKQVGKQVLLTFQLAVSIALIVLVLGIYKQLHFMKKSDLGFDKELLLRLDIPNNNMNKDAFKQEIEKLPFVVNSAYSDGCPGRINLRMGSNIEDNIFLVNCITIGKDYLKTMGIELIKGREFQSGDMDQVCLMNEIAVKRFGFDDIEGKKYMNGKEGGYEIIGITKDFHISPFYNAIEPVALIYNPDVASSMLSIRLLPGNTGQYTDQLRMVWKKFLPNEIMNITFYDEQFQSMYNKEEKLAKSIAFLSFVAMVLTCMGILSQIILTSLTRTKEIGVRKVNGAKVSDILIMLNKDFVKWIFIAFVIATPVSYYAISKWLQNFAYQTSLSWWIFILAGLITLCIALITINWQSWRSATRNPIEALRYE